ncbi:hypothetical protein K9M59_01620 [Candidatus Gracilibacteria bacterium]|nr:hypothetical protein [Candidatus Gracilibacteria bacterium]MCF7819766.1 hypothetical protein [Candidatus Gracilibacteria bacterium]
MKRKCRISGREFELHDRDLKFYERMDVPVPDICPEEIWRSLMALRNEWKLYRRKCDATGDTIISAYHKNSPYKIYKNEYWWGDQWDGLDYGREFDFSRPFFEQFKELQLKVPREGTSVFKCENCDYNSHIRESKNCYLTSLVYRCEDNLYSSWLVNNKDLVDCHMMSDCELCYECMDLEHCFGCVGSRHCANCNDCFFSYQLVGCDHCIGCSNLHRKSYYIANKKVAKEEFERVKKEILNGTRDGWEKGKQYFQSMWNNTVHRFVHTLKCENVVGDIMINSKNCFSCFEGWDSEDCAYSLSLGTAKDVYHCYSSGWPNEELTYYSAVTRGSQDIRFCYYIWFCSNMTYCDSCSSCQNCFGCVGLKHKQYCIFNRQYSKEEYFVLQKKIIQHMKDSGEWGTMPPDLSTFAYNETAAQEHYPLTKQEVEKMGYQWLEENESSVRGEKYIVPDDLEQAEDNIVEKVLICQESGKPYKIIPKELDFYKKMNVPIPVFCPQIRHQYRWEKRNPCQLFSRKCDQCQKEIQSSFDPDRSEKVFCEECYLRAVD